MTLLVESHVRERARSSVKSSGLTARQLLAHHAKTHLPRYDIFLSQAIRDEELVLGVYTILTEDIGLTVYCDWVEKPLSDRSKTTPSDAEYIKGKMLASRGLMFIDSEHAATSNWMSWEIGWFHGAQRRVCVLPIVRNENDQYRGREFLGLYPMVEEDDRFILRVPARLADHVARYAAPKPLALATWMPLRVWATLEKLPDYFLS
ncbi:toll-Interleukin receptor [Sinorhizobium medicae]|nr:toll-Interleukin receptor [Sinorhizobium medicae]MDX0894981.1 toll-Interleukin receptor [Sinorhizobium medicae]